MAFFHQKVLSSFLVNELKLYSPVHLLLSSAAPKTFSSGPLQNVNSFIQRSCSSHCNSCKPNLTFESGLITQFAVTEEIHFFRDSRNNFNALCYSDTKEQYGPPLVIILPWKDLDADLLKKFIEIYGEKGFDMVTVHLTTEQFLYPCVIGSAMSVVTDLIDYLNAAHKHRPYIFHGFSIGSYIFGEIMAQFSDHYDNCRTLIDNVKGCLWDSPIDVMTVKPLIGKAFYPKNWIRRCRCNAAVRRHFKKHYHDSVAYWVRSRNSFCNPMTKVPYVFFTSYTDVLSNPCCLHSIQKILECNGIPIYQKTWWDSNHGHHFMKYCYEYMYGMTLFFNLVNLFPDECGKYKISNARASLHNLRLNKAARDNLSQ